MSELKNSIKNNGLTLDYSVNPINEFDPNCIGCTPSCALCCSGGCAMSGAPSAKSAENQA